MQIFTHRLIVTVQIVQCSYIGIQYTHFFKTDERELPAVTPSSTTFEMCSWRHQSGNTLQTWYDMSRVMGELPTFQGKESQNELHQEWYSVHLNFWNVQLMPPIWQYISMHFKHGTTWVEWWESYPLFKGESHRMNSTRNVLYSVHLKQSILTSYSRTPICVRTSGLSSLISGRRIVCVYVQLPTSDTYSSS